MNLAKLALAAERFAQSQPPITLTAQQCVRTRDKSADCDRCVQVCPVGAIRLDGGVQIDADACIRCGLCLHSCPTGAISGTDNVRRLLYCASQLVDHEAVELACALHPDPTPGDSKMDAVITMTGCLATLGTAAYLSLAAQGVKQVRVRLDACAQCPLAPVQPEIEATIGRANDLLTTVGKGQTVAVAEPVKRPKRRPVYSIKNPPVSRRGFFQALGQGARDFLPPLEGESERPRLVNAVRRLSPQRLDEPVPGDDFVALVASEACNACATCARICPTGALEFARNDERFELTFAAAACVNCGLCLNYCEPQALQRRGAPTIGELIDTEPVILSEGKLNRCRRCNTLFAGEGDDGLCPVCAFRKKNPFGGRPAFLPQARPLYDDNPRPER